MSHCFTGKLWKKGSSLGLSNEGWSLEGTPQTLVDCFWGDVPFTQTSSYISAEITGGRLAFQLKFRLVEHGLSLFMSRIEGSRALRGARGTKDSILPMSLPHCLFPLLFSVTFSAQSYPAAASCFLCCFSDFLSP